MPTFGNKSMNKLMQCERDIQTIMLESIKYIDFSVTEGSRDAEQQFEYWQKGRTLKGKDPKNPKHWKITAAEDVVTTKDGYVNLSRHQLGAKSTAIDIVPYPTMWSVNPNFHELAGVIKTVQAQLLLAGRIEKLLNWGWDLWEFDRPHWQLED